MRTRKVFQNKEGEREIRAKRVSGGFVSFLVGSEDDEKKVYKLEVAMKWKIKI